MHVESDTQKIVALSLEKLLPTGTKDLGMIWTRDSTIRALNKRSSDIDLPSDAKRWFKVSDDEYLFTGNDGNLYVTTAKQFREATGEGNDA